MGKLAFVASEIFGKNQTYTHLPMHTDHDQWNPGQGRRLLEEKLEQAGHGSEDVR